MYSDVEPILENVSITSYSSYFVFGMHDALLRYWATDSTHQRFRRALDSCPIMIDDIKVFTSDNVEFLSPEGEPEVTVRLIQEHAGCIERVADAERRDSWDASPEILDDLAKLEGLGIVRTVPHAKGTKFYTFLQRIGRTVAPQGYELADLRQKLADSDLADVTLYSGLGYADYLFKAVAPDGYENMRPHMTEILGYVSNVGLKPLTVPLPNSNEAHVADALDAIGLPDDIRVHDFVAVYDHVPNVRAIVSSLPREQQLSLADVYEQGIRLFRGTAFERRFSNLFDGIVRDDNETLADSLSFLTNIERLLRSRLSVLLSSNSPPDGPPPCDMGGWNLKQLVRGALAAAADFPAIQAALDSELHSGWEDGLSEISRLRSDYAHGALFDQLPISAFDSGWERQVDDVLRAGALFLRLRDAV